MDFYVGDITSVENNRSRVLSTFINTVKDDNLGTSGHDYVYMQGTSMACPHVSGVAALGLSYAHKIGKKFSREEFVSMLLTSVNNMEEVNKNFADATSKSYIEDGQEHKISLKEYRKGKMGTGAIDAWKLLMSVEGTPSITVAVLGKDDKVRRYDLSEYFGGRSTDLTYLGVECDAATREALGIEEIDIEYGKLRIRPTKVGSGKVVIKAIAGYDEDEVADGMTQIGGMQISRTVSILSRGVASKNGGWL